MYTIDKHNKVAYYASMFKNTYTPQIETELVVTRDAQLDKDYYRKQATKRTVKLIGAAGLAFARYLVIDPLMRLGREIGHQLKLEMIDTFYHSNLHSQYLSGQRTQVILRTKREHNLV